VKESRRLSVPIFGGTVYLATSRKQLDKLTDRFDCERVGQYQGGCAIRIKHTKTGERIYLAAVFDGTIATLAHELAHVTFFILSHVGVEIEEDGCNETFCYLLTHLMHHFEKALR
jgi:hypothetical protein